MTDCPLQPDGDRFTCPHCGWTYHKMARRNCPKSPEGRAGRLLAILQQIAAEHEASMNWQMYLLRHLPDLEKNIDTCLDCPEHNGNTCIERGTDCKARGHWLKRLACVGFRECPRWQ